MTDQARSAQMALVRSRDTKVELRVRKFLHAAGLRYRLHDRRLPGAPDLVFSSRRTVVFIHGCFWHRHPGCAATRLPKSRQEFWEAKLSGNVLRDARQQAELVRLGWTVLTIWECETKDPEQLLALANRIRSK
jgi:DNA mismatch endonuclease (patch repair protein)